MSDRNPLKTPVPPGPGYKLNPVTRRQYRLSDEHSPTRQRLHDDLLSQLTPLSAVDHPAPTPTPTLITRTLEICPTTSTRNVFLQVNLIFDNDGLHQPARCLSADITIREPCLTPPNASHRTDD
ncbi:hypothetical protein BN1708_003116 [Verticillium longisporum]|uniref:Uncharacterized protein n=1 Tax=Verticillium longisporum TaxID=100787 RepID=A0A0G4L9M8_VERLO|nr:hypothetical protein BN1708_003116 [Verticillium longisporum]